MWFFYLVWMHLLSQDDVMCYPFHGTHSFCHFSMLFPHSFIHSFCRPQSQADSMQLLSGLADLCWNAPNNCMHLILFWHQGGQTGTRCRHTTDVVVCFFSAHFMLILSIYHPYNRTVNLFTEVSPLNLRLLYLKIAWWQDLCLHGIRAVLLFHLFPLSLL